MKQFNGSNMNRGIKKSKHNPGLVIIICCGIPLLLLLAAVYFFGLSKSYLFWIIPMLCIIMHYFMMKDMHKKHPNKKEDEGKCH